MAIRSWLVAGALGILASIFSGWQPIASAQENATAEQTSEDQTQNEQAEQSVSQQIQKLIGNQKPAQAAELLDKALADNPDDAALQRMRTMLAFAFLRTRDYSGAVDQWEKYFQAKLPQADSPREVEQLASIAQQISVFGSRVGKDELGDKVVQQAIERCEKLESEYPTAIQIPLARLTELRVTKLANEGETDAAKGLLNERLQALQNINQSGDATENTVSAELSLLATAANRFNDDAARERLNASFEKALEAYPESETLIQQYAMNEYATIASLMSDDPKQAVRRIEEAVAKLEPRAENSRSLGSYIGRIKSLKSRAEAAMKQQAMIGKPAPPLEVDAWANTDSATVNAVDDLKGKVVLFDFWAVWCGPCIATFPHLREWREEFGDQGFEIVGVTRYYGYKWDEENDRISRASEEVPPEEEQQAVAKFLQSKDMQHPTIFTPKNSDLQSQYAVTGIPHAVLVDRQGNVQMVKVGSGSANAEALHEKIKELIAQ